MPTALVVDDSKVDQRLAGRTLENQDSLAVSYADDGNSALAHIVEHAPDIVITDLQMPGMDGLELVETIRRNHPVIPVILMTAAGSEEVAAEALRRGAASYVPKRYLSRDLGPTAQRILSITGSRHEQERVIECLQSTERRFVINNNLERVQPLIAFLRMDLARLGLCDETDAMRISIALDEAITNAITHGNLEVDSILRLESTQIFLEAVNVRQQASPWSARTVHIDVSLTNDAAEWVIKDEGPGFEPDLVPDPTDPTNLDKPSGRGLMLIRTFMDEVFHNESGNEITMIKRRAVERK